LLSACAEISAGMCSLPGHYLHLTGELCPHSLESLQCRGDCPKFSVTKKVLPRTYCEAGQEAGI
jgi:hypothetical protein